MRDDSLPDDAHQRALLERWQSDGDTDALDELLRSEVSAIAARLRARGGGLMRGSISASDLAQEAVLRMLALDEQPRFETPAGLRAYLWTAAWRLLVNRAERRSTSLVRLDRGSSEALSRSLATTGGLSRVDADDQRAGLDVVINLLSPDDREMLMLVYFKNLSVDACAQQLGVAKPAAEMRLTRARRRLMERLASWADVVR